MQIVGIDFSSAPSPRKPIVAARCRLDGVRLRPIELLRFTSLTRFGTWLGREGQWLAGLDFPFGQPRELIEALGLPNDWPTLVDRLAVMPPADWERRLAGFRAARPAGRKEPLRRADRLADARSAMKLVNPPVGKMFFRGAPLLTAARVSVLPCAPTESGRIAVEAYPALVARRLIGRRPYKSDTTGKQTEARRVSRRELVGRLGDGALVEDYGVEVGLSGYRRRQLVEDASGDSLDALLCAIQAAWAWQRRDEGFGIPAGVDALEGWIVDPKTLLPG